jgi:hypothetical protein
LIPHQSEEPLPSILELTMNVGTDKSEPTAAERHWERLIALYRRCLE